MQFETDYDKFDSMSYIMLTHVSTEKDIKLLKIGYDSYERLMILFWEFNDMRV